MKRDATGDWTYHFVLVIPEDVHEDEDSASLKAGEHLFTVFQDGSSAERVASALREIGYVAVSDFEVAGDNSSQQRAFVPAIDSGE